MGCSHQYGLLWGMLDHWGGAGSDGLPVFMQICQVGCSCWVFQGSPTKLLSLVLPMCSCTSLGFELRVWSFW